MMAMSQRLRRITGDWLAPALTLIGFVAAWELLTRLFNVPICQSRPYYPMPKR